MGRSPHTTVDKLPEKITSKECDEISNHSGIPVEVVSAVILNGASVTPAIADSIRKSLHKSDRWRVTSKAKKPDIDVSIKAQRYGLPPEGYQLTMKPAISIEKGDLLLVSDRSQNGWIRVTENWYIDDSNRRNEICIPTECGIVKSPKKMTVRVAVHVDGTHSI